VSAGYSFVCRYVSWNTTGKIYFSVDFDATSGQQSAINAYFDGVASVIGRSRTGAYGGYHVIRRLFDAGKIAWGWQTYAWSGGQWDSRAQLRQVLNGITVDGADCDRNEAHDVDFGQWGGRPRGSANIYGVLADGRLTYTRHRRRHRSAHPRGRGVGGGVGVRPEGDGDVELQHPAGHLDRRAAAPGRRHHQ
jgi:hypothetical protein